MDPNPSGIDALTLAMLSIFGGAALTAGAGFFGAWLQNRREHRGWVRERRYEAYVAYARAEDAYHLLTIRMRHFQDAVDELKEWNTLHDVDPAAAGDRPPGLDKLGGTSEEQLTAFHRLGSELDAAHKVTIEAIAPFSILGPANVVEKAREVVSAEPVRRHRAMEELLEEMASTLGVKR